MLMWAGGNNKSVEIRNCRPTPAGSLSYWCEAWGIKDSTQIIKYIGSGAATYMQGVPPSGASCPSGQYWRGGLCIAYPADAPAAPSTKKMSDAVSDIPAGDLAKPVNPQFIADATNKWWQQAAAQPGYNGLPYQYSDPVTAQDVQTYQQLNPSTYPTVSDFVAPAINPATNTAPVATPSTSINPQTGEVIQPGITPTPDAAKVDLGVDPVIGAPKLEATPTAAMILAPLLNLFPDLRSFVVPSHSGVCPKPSMSFFGKTYVLDGHCSMFETVRPTLYAVMSVVWTGLALFIILAA